MISTEPLLDTQDVADILKVNKQWVANHCTRTEPFIKHFKLGAGRYANRRFRREDVMEFIERNMVSK